jgi:hypothetical protein
MSNGPGRINKYADANRICLTVVDSKRQDNRNMLGNGLMSKLWNMRSD